MNTLIHHIIRALVAPYAVVSSIEPVWTRLVDDLNKRSGCRRESGAFLLGKIENNGNRIITDYVLYDDLDPNALDNGAIHIRSSAYGALWKLCAEKNLVVVADIHTHPGSNIKQSRIDTDHPMISKVGHIAMILPNYGKSEPDPKTVAIYRYLGSYKWETLQTGKMNSKAFYLGRWVG